MKPRKRTLATTLTLMTGLALTATLVTIPSGGGAVASAANPRPSQISWHSCTLGDDDEIGKELDRAGAKCGEVVVPLDYTRPKDRKITLALSRLPAKNRADRIGTLMVNTGGPGAAALSDVLWVQQSTGDVGKRFDLVGMDPRFVGRSTPLDCGWPVGTWARGGGPDRASFNRTAAFQADLAQRCGARHADVLPFATTRNTARDMDVVRVALGEQQISYLGYSYGTYLGSVYTQMFPGRTDRLVLDSAVDPDLFGPRLLRPTGPANEAGLRDWARWAATHHDEPGLGEHGLGDTEAAVLATVDRILSSAARRPLRVGDFRLEQGVVTGLLMDGLGDDRDEPNAELAAAVRVLDRAARGKPAEPTPVLTESLTFILTGAESPYGSQQIAILCGDVAAPRNPEIYLRDIRAAQASEPRFATFTRNLGPCAFWPVTPRERPTVVQNSTPALIVQSTGDTRTTHQTALALHRLLTGSRLLTLQNARIHGVFGNYGNPCVDNRVNAYLRDGVLPATDISCAG
jgi:pimeloyl-ACP methyl ester carboxylesterase